MNRILPIFSPALLTALLFLPAVLLHSTPLRASNAVPMSNMNQPSQAISAEDILDIYGPLPLPEPKPYLCYALFVLLFLMLVVGIWVSWRYYKNRKETNPVDPARTALSSLDSAERKLPVNGVVFFADEVSQLLRSYIEARFHLPITSCTTNEFFRQLQLNPEADRYPVITGKDDLEASLELCDKIKFSRFLPESEAVRLLGERVRRFIEVTRLTVVEEI